MCRIPYNSRLPVHRCPSPGFLFLQSAQEGALSMGGACGVMWVGPGALSQSKAPLIRGGAAPPPWPVSAGTRWHAGPGPRRHPQVLARGSEGLGREGTVIAGPWAMRLGTTLGMVLPRDQGQGHRREGARVPR